MAVDFGAETEHDAATTIRHYTPSMLAELLGVPPAAIRRWRRQDFLRAVHCVRQLPYFDFEEVAVAGRLAALLKAGCSLRTIDRRLAELARLSPGAERPWADPAVVVEGRRLYLRRGDELAEPGGQLLLDFDNRADDELEDEQARLLLSLPRALAAATPTTEHSLEQLRQEAFDWEDEGQLDRAAEAYRTLLLAGGPRADVHFALADVLYRAGDLGGARERFYCALEVDEEYVEARASLGCVLAETGELELAAATFEGALAYHPDFADVHFHLAHVFDRMDRIDEAETHFRRFLDLAPEGPWAAAARDRLGAGSE